MPNPKEHVYPGTIPEETFESLAKQVPEIIKKKSQGSKLNGTLNTRLRKLKKLNVLHWLIMVGRIKGLKDYQIARMIGCHPQTIRDHGKKIGQEEWLQDMTEDMMDLAPLFRESMRMLLLNADAFATISFGKGMGILKEKSEITVKPDKEDQQKKYYERMKETLGLNVGNRLKPLQIQDKTDGDNGDKDDQ